MEKTLLDVEKVLYKNRMGQNIIDLVQEQVDSAALSFRLAALAKELEQLPEHSAYVEKHREIVLKYGRKPDEKDPESIRDIERIIDARCSAENREAYNKEESALLDEKIGREIKAIPEALFDGQKIRGTLLSQLYPFVEKTV